MAITLPQTTWVAVLFILGLISRHVGLPPLVGFLAAGFVLKSLGVESIELLQNIADLGITLLLFTIGLKLDIRSLTRAEIWGVSTLHMVITVVTVGLLVLLISLFNLRLFSGLHWHTAVLLAFALSFSSTVFAVKLLEDKGEMSSNHGRLAIGILIMQDVFAVVFLTASTGKLPSLWALALFGLLLLRPLFSKLMDRVGHGELFIMYGLILALGGAALFESVNMKADLGALVLGVLLAQHERAGELSRALLGFKDLFLVGFFLSVGLSATLSYEAVFVALLLVLIVPLKVILFFAMLTLFRMRARTSFLTSISLANFSEFGLIVGAIGFSNGWMTDEWLAILAIAMAITFVLASPLNTAAHSLYAKYDMLLKRFESKKHSASDLPIVTGEAKILIFGMGRVGSSSYLRLREKFGDIVLGLDYDAEVVRQHQDAGLNVIQGDATDYDFWKRLKPGKIEIVLLSMPNQSENVFALKQLAASGFQGKVAAVAKYNDQMDELKALGVNAAYNIYTEAGSGFAEHVREQLCQNVVPLMREPV